MSLRPPYAARAVLFDLDGTLLDTIGDLTTAVNLMLDELGRPPRSQAQIHSFVGKGVVNLVTRCLTEGSAASAAQIEHGLTVFRAHYERVNGLTTTIYPGVLETLHHLQARELPLAVVTNKAQDFTLPLLERMEIAGFFATVISGDTLAVRKPDPAPLRLACEHLGVQPEAALMIGDSANDALAARAAGTPVLLVRYGYSEGMPVDSIECDGLLSNAVELLDFLLPV